MCSAPSMRARWCGVGSPSLSSGSGVGSGSRLGGLGRRPRDNVPRVPNSVPSCRSCRSCVVSASSSASSASSASASASSASSSSASSSSSSSSPGRVRRVAVIGAGWGGWGAAKALLEGSAAASNEELEVVLFDATPDPTGATPMLTPSGKPFEPVRNTFDLTCRAIGTINKQR